ncbi:sialate O-acetylesterase-like [Mytilus californianus]|uniref:sialate O-acetylesterase-like n=1 Tax=Mytilus californianus TaxID=6549 RepID=UPI002246AD92|nr:sialate O-acetylesterase-like [Mytilus californianus]
MKWFIFFAIITVLNLTSGYEKRAVTFSFSSFYANHMVLQRGSRGASVWGHSPKHGDKIDLYLDDQHSGSITVDPHGIWQGVVHNPGGNHGYKLTASSSLGNITLKDVWFGDVWLCSGQSNMAFIVGQLANATDEVSDTSSHQDIRLFKAKPHLSTTPLTEFTRTSIGEQWLLPTAASVKYFSAVCWLFGKYLSSHVSYPIGLVESDWGGTPVEAWSSPDALQKCNSTQRHLSPSPVNQHSNNVLWNGMIHPFLKSTIYGALWYQGEANSRNAFDYSCRFPAMIDDWRSKFHSASLQTVDAMFPFGFVQLAPNRNTSAIGSFPLVRWAQTANHGKVPNNRLKNVFMAVALDLPDYASPRGHIHPRLKHDVAARLVLGALAVAYKKSGIDYQGPYPSSYTLHRDSNTLTIEYDNGRSPIDVRNTNGFQICCSSSHKVCHAYAHDYGWTNAPIKSHDTSSITLDTSKCSLSHHSIGGIRYEWSESPCDLKQCAIYGAANYLPSPPFIVTRLFQ